MRRVVVLLLLCVALPTAAQAPCGAPEVASGGGSGAELAPEVSPAPCPRPATGFPWLAVAASAALLASARWWLPPAVALLRTKSDNRQLLASLVEEEPGIHFAELRRRSGLGNGSVDYHLHGLLAAGDIVSRLHGGYRCYFPAGPAAPQIEQAVCRKAPTAKCILDLLRASGAMSRAQLAKAVGVTPAAVSKNVQRLHAAGLVRLDDATWPPLVRQCEADGR